MGEKASAWGGRLKTVLQGIFWGTAGVLILLLIALVISTIVTDDPVEGSVAEIERSARNDQPPRVAAEQIPEPKDEPAAVVAPTPDREPSLPESKPERADTTEENAPQPEPPPAEIQQHPAEPEPKDSGLSEASTVTLGLFQELYEFRNDPEFHRIGFSVSGQFNAWMVRFDETQKRYHEHTATPAMPAAKSSAMMPHPPGRRSKRRMGQGLRMSNTLKHTNAAASHGSVLGRNKQVTHIPTNSSQTASFGSWSSSLMRVPTAQTPARKPAPTRMNNP